VEDGVERGDKTARGRQARARFCLLALAFGFTSAAAQPAITETQFFDDLPVVLSASRLSQPVHEAPAAVTVIDQDMIRASGFRDIPDLFRLVPGFTVAYTRDNTWGVGYHGLADAFSRRMQVLVDGRSVYTPGFGMVPWASLPLSIEDIERIEVVRGPNSAAYGSNAFLGVINIITREASQVPRNHASLQAGQQGMAGALYRHGGGAGALRYRITLSEQRRDRFDTQPEETATRHLDLRTDYRLSPTDELSSTLALSRGDWRQGRPTDFADPLRDVDVGSEHLQLKFRRVLDVENEWSLQAYHTRLRYDDAFAAVLPSPPFPPSSLAPVELGYTQWREDIEFQRIGKLSERVRIVWGAEARWEGVDAPGYFYAQDERKGALYRAFGNMEWRPSERWIVNAGALAERHYISGSDLAPRLAVNFLPIQDHALRASLSEAYRSPTFFEESGDQRFFYADGTPLDRIFAPSAGLESERILSREIGYVGHVRPWHIQVDVRLFDDRIEGVIGTGNIGDEAVSVDPKLLQSSNQQEVDIHGGDVQVRWSPVRHFDLVVAYARVDVAADDKDVAASAPRHNFSVLAIARPTEGWETSLAAYRVGRMYWLSDGDVTAAYTRIDARVASRWKQGDYPAEIALVGQNLGRDPYEEFRDTNLFDRRAYVSLTFDW
jgi:iron complex outermembrane receptor protein